MSGDLPTPPPAQRSTLYAADGRTVITTFYEEDRTDVPLSAVAPVMRQAMVAAEDTRFYAHHGVDLRGCSGRSSPTGWAVTTGRAPRR
ncbi:hypothetical protein GCM10027605_61480 [Micromonospora zhanjiangensis]